MTAQVIFITHSTSEDNEAGLASGWFDTPLSAAGERQAVEVRDRWAGTPLDAVIASNLERGRRTAQIAFEPRVTVRIDPRLREVDYGDLTRRPRAEIDRQRVSRAHDPHPGGESYAQAVERHRRLLDEVVAEYPRGQVLLVGSYALWMAMEHVAGGRPLLEVAAEQREWQPGWRYTYG
ncbi:MAG: histidine phosphatase family protein [Dehalococcoidia bacterium]|nr:histidine phosphatase family protein [Dehalococcoidia bacterium]